LKTAEKETILENQKKLCNNCKCSLVVKYEFDHIKPLSAGGTNEFHNFQALCIECHNTKSAKEASERVFKIDNVISTYNKITLSIFSQKRFGFIFHQFKPKSEKTSIFGIDLNKCRKNILRYSKFDYCVFSVLDDPQIFKPIKDQKLPVGFYFVDTDSINPLKGANWYSYPLVQYCLDNNIIKIYQITHAIFPSIILPAAHYNAFIDEVYAKAGNLAKVIGNSFVGLFGHKINTARKTYLTTSINEASYHYFNNRIRK